MATVVETFKNLPKKTYLELVPRLKEEKTQAFTTVTLTFITLMLFGFFAINPTLSTIVKLQKELSDSRFVNKSLEEKITHLSLLQQKYNALERDIPIIINAVPKMPSAPLFVGQIQSLATSHNVTITNLQTLEVEFALARKSEQRSFGFTIEVQGSYEALSQFLSSLVNFERIVTVDTFSITRTSDQNAVPKLSLRGKTYFKE